MNYLYANVIFYARNMAAKFVKNIKQSPNIIEI